MIRLEYYWGGAILRKSIRGTEVKTMIFFFLLLLYQKALGQTNVREKLE